MQDVRKLEGVEPWDMTKVTSSMLEKEGLWRRVEEGVVLGEGTTSWDAGEGSTFIYMMFNKVNGRKDRYENDKYVCCFL